VEIACFDAFGPWTQPSTPHAVTECGRPWRLA